MGRPPLALGTFGALRVYRTDNGWRVRTYVRDPDGKTREVERRGRTKNAAEQALKTALRDRSNHGGTRQEITQTTKVRVLAESWFAEFAGTGNLISARVRPPHAYTTATTMVLVPAGPGLPR
jgi:hypothetical protein